MTNLVGTNDSTTSRVPTRCTETGQFVRRAGQGRTKGTTVAADHFLTLTVLRPRHCTTWKLQNDLLAAWNIHLCLQTVINRLRVYNIKARVPATGPQLTREYRWAGLEFVREHAHCGVVEWSNVLFSDESRYDLHNASLQKQFSRYRKLWEDINYGVGWNSYRGHTELVSVTGGRRRPMGI